MPAIVKDWKEALFMGYFGPIGAGAVFYLEHSRHLFPEAGLGDEEENDLIRAISPVVYWLVLFVHGLSIPALNLIYNYMGVKSIQEDPIEIHRLSTRMATPSNAVPGSRDTFIAYNRFSRPVFDPSGLPVSEDRAGAFDKDRQSSSSYMENVKPPPLDNQYKWSLYPSEQNERPRTIRYAS